MIRDTKTARYQQLVNSTKRELGGSLRVGLVGEKAQAPTENDPNLTVAELGVIQEFGSAQHHIPSRSFIRAFFDENKVRIQSLVRDATLRALRSNNPKKALHDELSRIGQMLAGEMQGRILRMIPPPNTLMTEDRKGFNSPLIDTGQLYDAISWELAGMATF